MVPKSSFFRCKNITISSTIFSWFLMFLGCFFWWIFEPWDLQFWAYRVDETPIFTILTSPNHSQKTSRIRVVKNIDFWIDLGSLLEHFWTKKAIRNQVKKGVGKKLEKSGPQGRWGRLGRDQETTFLGQTPCWGVGGYNPKQHTDSPTRPWAEGPANFNNFDN